MLPLVGSSLLGSATGTCRV